MYKEKELEFLIINYTGDLIKNQNCIIINQNKSSILREIYLMPYEDIGCGGTIYYLGGNLLFKTIDRIY